MLDELTTAVSSFIDSQEHDVAVREEVAALPKRLVQCSCANVVLVDTDFELW